VSVGWKQTVALRLWAVALRGVFGEMPYLVGSATVSKDWRDVDVVVLLSDEGFYHWAGPQGMRGARWQSICAAFSAWGKEITGLPIDFKFQPARWANGAHSGRREALIFEVTPEFVDGGYVGNEPHPSAADDLMSEVSA